MYGSVEHNGRNESIVVERDLIEELNKQQKEKGAESEIKNDGQTK